MSLIDELKRRNVFRVGIAYLALGWVVTQVTATVTPALNLPASLPSIVVWIGVIGFPFVVVFSWVYELTPEGLKRESEIDRSASVTHVTGKRLDTIIIGMLGLAMLLFVADRFLPRGASDAGADAPVGAGPARDSSLAATSTPGSAQGAIPQQEPAAAAPGDKSIAVLPFADMSADKDQEYMSDGIAEELLNLLARIPELEVTSRSSAFAFKGEKIDIGEVARKLHVAHILEGSVRKSGNRVRITAQLIDARTDKHVWSQSYDRDLDDIFAVQDEIAGAVVEQLKVALLGHAPTVKATDPAAYTLFLQAQQMRRQGQRESWEQAVVLYQKALAIDPDYAAAWEGLGATYTSQASNGLLGSFEAGYRQARETIEKALAVDPGYALAHARLGSIALQYDSDLAAAARHYQRALELAPTDHLVIGNASQLSGSLGRAEEVLALDRYVAARDPVNPFAHNALGTDYWILGRLDESIAAFNTALALSPGIATVRAGLAVALLQKGNRDAALAEAGQEPAEVWRLMALGLVRHTRGEQAAADAALQELVQKHADAWSYQIAAVYAFRGEADRAFEWLGKAVAKRDPGMASIPTDPLFANIHADPRWLPFLRGIGKAPEQLAAVKFEVKLPQ